MTKATTYKEIDAVMLGKLCEKFDISTANLKIAADAKQKIIKSLKKELKNTPSKSFRHNGYVYYLKAAYTMNYFDVSRFKKEHLETYKQYLKQTTVNEQIVRRIDNAKDSK